jgi:GNAT superfamily N-acetyltransferase
MTVVFRSSTRADVPAIVALLRDDTLGAAREASNMGAYLIAFDAMRTEGTNMLIVGEHAGQIVATYQLTFITGLSLRAARRAHIESVRVAASMRGQGLGRAMFADAETRARAAGCRLMQLTMNKSRTESGQFYQQLGFTPSHIGFKRDLS